jgi:phospholipase/lecithinase/hemolysin
MATVPVLVVLHVLLVAAAAACAAAAGSSSKVPAMYVFGDSTADVGTNNYLPGGADVPRANFPHNGVDFPTARPTGRFSNGYNGVDFLGKHALSVVTAARPAKAVHSSVTVHGCDARG